MSCLMCSSFDSKSQWFQGDVANELFKKITFVLPVFKIPESKDPICICTPCKEQVTYFYTIKKVSLQNCCHLKHFKTMLNVTNKLEFNELNIQISNNEVSAQQKHSELKVNPNHKNLLSLEDEDSIHIKEEAQEYDDYSQQLENVESNLNYLKNEESRSSTQHHVNVGAYEFVDVNKFTIKDSNVTSSDSRHEDQPKTQRESQKNKAFTYRSELEQHSRVHTGKKPYKCTTCQKTFTRLEHLKRHKLIHTGEKPHECDVCHKTFNDKSNLVHHKLVHSNLRPFKCVVCNKTFMRSDDLTKHIFKHTGEKPHHCHLCQFKCAQAWDLKVHIRRHTGEKPYNCKHCEKSFTTTSNLNVHKRRHHVNEDSN